MKVSSAPNEKITTFLVGLVCAVSYFYLSTLSNAERGIDLFDFLNNYLAVTSFVIAYWIYLQYQRLTLSVTSLIFWAIVFRILGVFGSPILEDDFYRYLLDGCVFISTGSPYGITPESLFQKTDLSDSCQQALTWVNNPDIPTIYGPVLQYFFAFSHLLSSANINVLQIILSLFDLGLICLLLRFSPTNYVMLYAWSPLVLKEVVFTAHPDIVGVFFLFFAFITLQGGYKKTTCLLCGAALASKIFAILIVPFIIFRLGIRYWLLTVAVVITLYLPFLIRNQTDIFVLGIFAQHWLFNASGFLIAKLFMSDQSARLLCFALFSVVWIVYFFHFNRQHILKQTRQLNIPRGDWIFAVFFFLSPVFNAWYLVWLLPFAVIYPSYWAWTLSIVVSLTYVTGLNMIESSLHAYEIALWAIVLEFGAVAVALLFDIKRYFRAADKDSD